MTGTYRLQTGYYGLSDSPTEFKKTMEYTLIGLKNTYCFLDDNLIVGKRSEEDHNKYALNRLKRLDDENFRINLSKCHFAKRDLERLGYNLSQTGTSPVECKISAILILEAPQTLKKLPFFLGSVYYISKYNLMLAQNCHPLLP